MSLRSLRWHFRSFDVDFHMKPRSIGYDGNPIFCSLSSILRVVRDLVSAMSKQAIVTG
jgi:hypothetical protein